MFSLAPFTSRPAIHASRADHGPFLNTIISRVEDLISEKDIVGMENRKARDVFNSMDLFFTYGLLAGDSNYWRFVKQFLPRTEQEMLRAEWGDVNGRKLSLAWLKDAFNKGSLSFQLLGLRLNKKVAQQFYHRNAFINNAGMLESITDVIDKLLSAVQFSFYTNLHPRQEEQAIVVEHRNARHNKSKSRFEDVKDENVPVVRNIVVPPPSDILSATPVDQDAVMNIINWRRRRFDSHRKNSFDKDEQEIPAPVNPGRLPVTIPREVMNSKLSEVDIAHRDPKPVDQLFPSALDNMKICHEEDDIPVEGEEIMTSGDLLQLAVNIFTEEGERLIRMYNIYESFQEGAPVKRLLAISDYNMYLLSKTHNHNPADFAEERHSADVSFFVHTIIPLTYISSVEVGLSKQWFNVSAKGGLQSFKKIEAEKKTDSDIEAFCSLVKIATGDTILGNEILNTLQQACSRCHADVNFITDFTPYIVILKRFLSKECGAVSSEVLHYSLVFWKETSASPDYQEFEHSGYVNWRFIVPTWFRKPTDAEESFLLLQRDRKLYLFSDSSMKEGIAIYDLRKCSETSELDRKRDMQWYFHITFPDGKLELVSQSKDDLLKWMLLIRSALTAEDEDLPAASMLLATETHIFLCQEGSRFIFDGFVRSLITFMLSEIQYGWVIRGEPHVAILLRVRSSFQWLFFRTEAELDKFLEHMEKYPIGIEEILSKTQSRETAFIVSICARSPDSWLKHIQDKDAAEVFAN